MTGAAAAVPARPPATRIPWLGLTAVLLGTFISTLNGRLSSFGLADIRGAVHAGFDEGAWITTAAPMAQMMIAPFAVWAGAHYGPRRILVAAALSFALLSSLIPLARNLPTLLVLQFLSGLGSGCFVPLTLSFILRNTPPRYWAYGVALYALNLELSLNISASLEGWYVDHLSWRWIFWQNVPLALAMAACLLYGMTPQSGPPLRQADRFGLLASGVGLALIFAAVDQGNRLDWLNSGLVCGLLLAGLILQVAFLIHEWMTPKPWINLRVALAPPLPLLMTLISLLRLAILSTAYLIPQFLGPVRGFRALEVGETLDWIALPQLVICPLSAFMLRRTDPRVTAGIGLLLVACACLMVAHGLTPLWGSEQFLLSQLIQAVGQSLALSGIVFIAVLNLRPEEALTLGAMIQLARLMGGEIGQGFVVTLVRLREQHASNLLGLHVRIGDADVLQRIAGYARALTRSGLPDPRAGEGLLGAVVRSLATTQSVIDGFVGVAAVISLGLVVLALVRPPPRGPASPSPLFAPLVGRGP